MISLPRLRQTYIDLSEHQANRLQTPRTQRHAVEVHPPRDTDLPATLQNFVRGIEELQSKWLKLKNTSPLAAFEIRRVNGQLSFQFVAENRRVERKIRLHLTTEIPSVSFGEGVHGLPVAPETSIGGGLLTAGRGDWYPFQSDFDKPPANAVASTLHRHAMRDTDVVIQILFQPVIGQPLRRQWWRRRAYHRIGYLRKEKEKIWGSRSPTPREKRQANQIEDKAGTNRFWTSIRIAVIGAGEHTASRVKELAGAFNLYENPETSQYFNTITVESIRETPFLRFCQAIADRRFNRWSRRFQTSVPELAALVSIPGRQQQNITYAHP